MMTSTFDSFDASKLGAFVESPLGARNEPRVGLVYVSTAPTLVVPEDPTQRPVVAALQADDLSTVVVQPFEVSEVPGSTAIVGGDDGVLYVTADHKFPFRALDPQDDLILLRTGSPPDPLIPVTVEGGVLSYVGWGNLKGTARTVWAHGTGFREPEAITFQSFHIVELTADFELLTISESFVQAGSEFASFDGITGGDNRLWIITRDVQRRNTLIELSIPEFREDGSINAIQTIPFAGHPVFGNRRAYAMGGGDGPLWLLMHPILASRPIEAFEYDPDARGILQGPVRLDDLPGLSHVRFIGGA